MANIEAFRNNIIEGGVLDPVGVHHEFVSGMHGRKLDFDTIADGSPLYNEWINVLADYITEEFPVLPEIIIGVANGTNRVALDTARRFNGEVIGLVSEKDKANSKVLRLSAMAGKLIVALKPELVVVLEDVGTTGSNSVQVAKHSLEAGAKRVKVVNTWKRRPQLECLVEAGVDDMSIIDEPLETYAPEECQAFGYCAQNWKFIER